MTLPLEVSWYANTLFLPSTTYKEVQEVLWYMYRMAYQRVPYMAPRSTLHPLRPAAGPAAVLSVPLCRAMHS